MFYFHVLHAFLWSNGSGFSDQEGDDGNNQNQENKQLIYQNPKIFVAFEKCLMLSWLRMMKFITKQF